MNVAKEEEIDLKPYLLALLRRWWIIVGVAIGSALIAGVSAVPRTPTVFASASLLIIPANTQITLDSRFTSRDSLLFTTTTNQREALLALARDVTLEQRVAEALGREYRANELLSKLTFTTDGDLLRITARAETNDEAQQLVTVWAQEYARMVNETYTRDTTSFEMVQQQLTNALQRYYAAQAALESFIAQGQITEADQDVRRLNDLINSSRTAGTDLFRDYLLRSNDLEQILRDARLLRERLDNQPEDEVNIADALAALLLRIRNLSDQDSNRPILQLDSSLANSVSVTVADLDRLIDALEAEQSAVRSEAARLSELPLEELSPEATKQLYQRLADAQARLEQLNGRQRDLVRNRDVAFDLVNVLMRRVEELRLSDAAPQVSVRYLGTVSLPQAVISRQVITQVALAALAGVVSAAAIIVLLEAITISRRSAATQPKPTGD
ncbi:lipopolysaccharide biosynthesis protein [uncultured Chloroflexus sp.]|uniref:lipopolysaccharide biosynthesis protein n=1 Tax=uncultured Chloroflexus sp. TaxID=214040 RepID=UPI002633F529|nr:lipopolysaccharide biosynthesis protein [uncultured Chloroflexus sp.]